MKARYYRDDAVSVGFGFGWEQTENTRWLYVRLGRHHHEWRWAR